MSSRRPRRRPLAASTPFLFGLLGCFTFGCRSLPLREVDDFGLILVEVTVDAEGLTDLHSTVWRKQAVPGLVRIDGTERRVNIRYAGKSSLDDAKKTLHLEFVDTIFRGHSAYRLAAQSMDKSMLRAPLGFRIFELMGLGRPKLEPAAVYLNGEYVGLFYLLEPVDVDFFSSRGIGTSATYKAVLGNADFTRDAAMHLEAGFSAQSKPKSYAALEHLVSLVAAESSDENLLELDRELDIQNYLSYIAAAVYLHHFDGFRNNFIIYQDTGSSRMTILPWDLDRIFEAEGYPYEVGRSIWGDNTMTAKLLTYPRLRRNYLKTLHRLLTELAPPERLGAMIDDIAATIGPAFHADRYLTAKGRTLESEREKLLVAARAWLAQLKDDVNTQQGLLDQR